MKFTPQNREIEKVFSRCINVRVRVRACECAYVRARARARVGDGVQVGLRYRIFLSITLFCLFKENSHRIFIENCILF